MSVYRDHCRRDHSCGLFDHADTVPANARCDYCYRCEVCGQRYHVTGTPGSLRGNPIGKPYRQWRRRHPSGGVTP